MTTKTVSLPMFYNLYDMQSWVYSPSGSLINTGGDNLVHVSGSNGVYNFDLAEDVSSYEYTEVRIHESGTPTVDNILWYGSLLLGEDICRDIYPPVTNISSSGGSSLTYSDVQNIVDSGVTVLEGRTPSTGVIPNMEKVFGTDFATNYSTTNSGWVTYPAGYYDQVQGSNQQFPDNFASLLINSSGHISRVTLLDSGVTSVNTGDIVSAMLTEANSFKADVSNLPTITYLTNLMNSGIYVTSLSSGAIEDIFSTYPIAESYASTGTPGTPAQILYFMQQTFSQFSISGVTITVKKLDGSTTAATFLMDNSGAPTSRVRAT